MTNKTKKTMLLFAGVVVVVGVILFRIIPHPPRSLSEAVLKHEDEFSKPQYVLLPPSAESRLGREPERPLTDDVIRSRRISTKPTPCFFVAPREAGALNRIDVSYTDSRELSAEFQGVITAVSGNVSQDDTANMTLTNLKIVSGVGVPILSGACDFSHSRSFEVVTSEIVAGTVSLKLSRKLGAAGSGSVASQPPGSPQATAKTGWKVTEDGFVQGENIVISGALTKVEVNVDEATHDLGTTPPIGESWPFPLVPDGKIVIDGFDDGARTLAVRVDVPLGATQAAPAGLKTCEVRSTLTLRPAERCDFWLPTGNALVAVQWAYKTIDGVRHVVMEAKGYRTTFAAVSPTPSR